MHYMRKCFPLFAVLMFLGVAMASAASAGERQYRTVGGYLVVSGKVADVSSGLLRVDGDQYPVSKFVSVYQNGQQVSFKMILDVGRIDKADLYILGGKVEKIVVLKII